MSFITLPQPCLTLQVVGRDHDRREILRLDLVKIHLESWDVSDAVDPLELFKRCMAFLIPTKGASDARVETGVHENREVEAAGKSRRVKEQAVQYQNS